MSDGFVSVEGVRLRYLDYGGGGPPLVLSHGTGLVARMWDELAPVLTQRYHVLSLERRGHGDSDKPESGYQFTDGAREFAGFCDALGLQRVDAVGHSAGGTLLAFVPLFAPGLLRAAVLIDPIILGGRPLNGGRDGETMADRIRRRRPRWESSAAMYAKHRERAPYDTWTEAALRNWVRHGTNQLPDGSVELKCPPAIEAKMYEHDMDQDMLDVFAGAACALRIIRAEHTDRFPAINGERACAVAPDCRMVTMPGVTHFAPMEQPVAVAQLALNLLAAAGRNEE